jgi:hypothetical protein
MIGYLPLANGVGSSPVSTVLEAGQYRETGVCSTWNIFGNWTKAGNVPRGTNARLSHYGRRTKLERTEKQAISGLENQKFSTEIHFLSE